MNARADFLREECDNVEKTLGLIEELLGFRTLGKHEAAALGTYLHNAYSGVERLLRSLLDNRGIRVASAPTWHKDLLQRAHKEDLLSPDQFDGFLRLLAFRHVYVHGYSHMLDEKRLREIAVAAPGMIRAFLKEIRSKG